MVATLCNMCLIEAPDGRVLVQHRLPKPDNAWAGLTSSQAACGARRERDWRHHPRGARGDRSDGLRPSDLWFRRVVESGEAIAVHRVSFPDTPVLRRDTLLLRGRDGMDDAGPDACRQDGAEHGEVPAGVPGGPGARVFRDLWTEA